MKTPSKKFAMKIINALSDAQESTFLYGGEWTVAPVTTTTGIPCQYFTAEQYTSILEKDEINTRLLHDYDHWRGILHRLWQRNNVNPEPLDQIAWNTRNFKTKVLMQAQVTYTLRCQSNETEKVVAYYCKARDNINWGYQQIVGYNVYRYLATGFYNNGIDRSSNSTDNIAMTDAQWTPFDSWDFASRFKIYKVKQLTIEPSEQKSLSIKTKPRLITPAKFFRISTENNGWLTVQQSYEFNKHSQFILFKIVGRPAGAGTQTTNYARAITYTTPTVIMQTKFKYAAKAILQPTMEDKREAIYGVVANANPAIIVPDGDAVGEEKSAI